MKVLVIPDVHLKPWVFQRAAEAMREGGIDRAISLMDIADDWGNERNINLYEETYDAAIQFAKDFPDTLWCYGNHDISYVWERWESGFSDFAMLSVRAKLQELRDALSDSGQLGFIHRIDNVLFMHGGLYNIFVQKWIPKKDQNNIDAIIEQINEMGARELWSEISPLWARPQDGLFELYKAEEFLQVVGHTPVFELSKQNNLISCDCFSTYPDGRPIGPREFALVDTETWELERI